MMSVFEVTDIFFSYHEQMVLNGVSLSIKRGEVLSLLGPNGSGKTTILKILLGILRPKTGEVVFDGRPLSSVEPRDLAKRVAYVPQVHREAFGYTVEDVVLMGRLPHRPFFSPFTDEDRRITLGSLEKMRITHLRGKPYTEISGGERQLALIARALTQGADIFVMDEPVNGLDYGNQLRLLQSIKELSAHGITFVLTTHNPDHAFLVADQVALFSQGSVIAHGPPDRTVTENVLHDLYGVRVRLQVLADQQRFCVPCLER